METVAGIFNSRPDALRAADQLRSIGLADDRINVLTPGTDAEAAAEVPTSDTEQRGVGTALGGVVGGALGAAGGMHIGAAVASLFVPGVGPILASGIMAAALLGLGGAASGAAVGSALEDATSEGLPRDELFIYEDALRRGRTVLIAFAGDATQANQARDILARNGAESLDAARESWWVGLRSAEEEEYARQGANFKAVEPKYRSGFEAAQHPRLREKTYAEAVDVLDQRYPGVCREEAFRQGYERGRAYCRDWQERHKKA